MSKNSQTISKPEKTRAELERDLDELITMKLKDAIENIDQYVRDVIAERMEDTILAALGIRYQFGSLEFVERDSPLKKRIAKRAQALMDAAVPKWVEVQTKLPNAEKWQDEFKKRADQWLEESLENAVDVAAQQWADDHVEKFTREIIAKATVE